MKLPRILLVDDHEVVRRGIVELLRDSRPDWKVCGEAATGREGVAAAARLKPDVVVMDLSMPDMNGLDATREILKQDPPTEVLILSIDDSPQMVHDVLSAGARGYLLKADAGDVLITALEAVRRHEVFLNSKVSDVVLKGYLRGRAGEAPADASFGLLGPRELEIVKLIAAGKSNKEVANILEISVRTVESHRGHIMDKLGIHSVTELVRYAIRNNVVSPE